MPVSFAKEAINIIQGSLKEEAETAWMELVLIIN
jgi:hypothetical protein